jgi:uncharacterized membrane protein YhaH (DUF805 family)
LQQHWTQNRIIPMSFSYLLLSFNGRILRTDFWLGYVLIVAFAIGASILLALVFGDAINDPEGANTIGGNHDLFKRLLGLLLFGVAGVLWVWMGFAIRIKRCHDRGKSGWWSLVALLPVVGLIWVIIDLGIMEGDEGPNKYGPKPLKA